MGKSPRKKQQKPMTQADLVNIYSKLTEYSKEELLLIKQQLINQTEQVQQLQEKQKRSKSNTKKTEPQQKQTLNQNKLFVIASSELSDPKAPSNKTGVLANHQLDSVNIYLQQSNLRKGKKQLAKKKKNMDLVAVCNESTIMAQSKMEEDINGRLIEDQIDEEVKNMPQTPEGPPKLKAQRLMQNQTAQEEQAHIDHYEQSVFQRQTSLGKQLRTSQQKVRREHDDSLTREFSQQNQMYQTNAGGQSFGHKNVKSRRYDQQQVVVSQRMQSLTKKSQGFTQDKSQPRNNIQSKSIDSTPQQSIKPKPIKKQEQNRNIESIPEDTQSYNQDVLQASKADLFSKFSSQININLNQTIDLPIEEDRDQIIIEEEVLDKIQHFKSRSSMEQNALDDTQYLLNYMPLKATVEQTPENPYKNQDEQEQPLSQLEEIPDSPFKDKNLLAPSSTKNKQTQNKPKAKPVQQIVPKREKRDFIFCQTISVEPYMKRTMQKLGWIDLSTQQSNQIQFHIRFDITDKEGTHNKLKPYQWYNHFPNNRELTTKAGLCKNLWQQCLYDYELKIDRFFPRCYDLSDTKQSDLFLQDFQQTSILSIIKLYSLHFLKTTKNINQQLSDYQSKKQYNQDRVFKQKFKLKCSKIDQLLSGAGSMLGNDVLRLALKYAKQNILNKRKLETKQKMYNRKFTEEDLQTMVEYSQQLANGEANINQKFPIYEQVKTLDIHYKLCKHLRQYSTIDGTNNVWVVKPSYNARGLGVYCANKLKDIIQQGKKSQSKIVQKYIENPYLINKKKFDIRQWVLVTSWEPLDLYIFSSAYLKLCSTDFSLSNLADQYRHLSNFSIQKNNKQAGAVDEYVMSVEQFVDYVREERDKEFSWENGMQKKIEDVIYKAFRGVQDSMEQRPNTFEVYGLDIILDENLDPWLIEVNLSPACNERTDYLSKMLDDMSLDLLTFVENKIILQNTSETEWEANFKEKRDTILRKQASIFQSLSLNDEQFYEENKILHRWVRVQDCIQEIKNYQISMQIINNNIYIQNKGAQQPLEVNSTKLDFKQEKKIDKMYKKQASIEFIQRFYRGFKGRQVFKKLKQQKSSLLIQRYLRSIIAKNKVLRLQQNKASTLIQKYLRRTIAINKVKSIIADKIAQAKLFVALKIQALFRKKRAMKQYMIIRKNYKANRIKVYMKRYLAKKKVKAKMDYKCMIVRIQRFYKKRYAMKSKKATFLKKYLKGILSRQKVLKLFKVSRSAQKLKQIYNKKKLQSAFKWLKINKVAVFLQSLIRMKIQLKKYKSMLINKAQNQIKTRSRLYTLMTMKRIAYSYRTQMEWKCLTIQKLSRRFLARKKVKSLLVNKLKSQKAVLIQKYLRSIIAKNIVSFKFKYLESIVKIQSFFRMFKAKKLLCQLKSVKAKIQEKKKKKIEKKFQKTKRVEKDIENYIESLFHRELQQQKNSQVKQVTSQTPLSGLRRKDTPTGSTTNLNRQKSFRQSFTSLNQPSSQAQLKPYNDNQSSSQKEPPSTTTTVNPNQGNAYFEYIGSSYNKGRQATSQTQQQQDDSDAEEQEILATSDILQENNQQADRQQKQLRIRKQKNTGIGSQLAVNHQLSNLTQNMGSKNNYMKEVNQKVNSHLSKIKTPYSNQSSQRQQFVVKPAKAPPKPKNFSENLMNMLALQNIGSVFSENPVEALSILKENPQTNGSQNFSQQRRNSNVSRVDQSFSNAGQSQRNQYDGQVLGPNNIQNISSSTQNTLDQTQKPLHFPKLTDFKSATNNIYLAQRPVMDPRSESEFQQAIIENKIKKESINLSQVNKSREGIQGGAMDLQRKSTESLSKTGDKSLVNYQEIHQDTNYQLLQARPTRDISQLMVLQAYKRQHQPIDLMKKQKIKKRGESMGLQGSTHKPKKYEKIYSGQKKVGQQEIVIPQIGQENNKLVII